MGKSPKAYRLERDEALERIKTIEAEFEGKLTEATRKAEEVGYRKGCEENRQQREVARGQESYESLQSTRTIWANRAQSYEAEVKRLKALIGKAVGMIVEEAL